MSGPGTWPRLSLGPCTSKQMRWRGSIALSITITSDSMPGVPGAEEPKLTFTLRGLLKDLGLVTCTATPSTCTLVEFSAEKRILKQMMTSNMSASATRNLVTQSGNGSTGSGSGLKASSDFEMHIKQKNMTALSADLLRTEGTC